MLYSRREFTPGEVLLRYLNDTEIEQVETLKCLSVLLDSTLPFDVHIAHLSKRDKQRIYVLRKMRGSYPKRTGSLPVFFTN